MFSLEVGGKMGMGSKRQHKGNGENKSLTNIWVYDAITNLNDLFWSTNRETVVQSHEIRYLSIDYVCVET